MCTNNNHSNDKGEEKMNACAMKPNSPFVTSKTLKRTPASKENIERVKFMDSHNFSFDIDKNNQIKIQVSKKT